jgi:predicted AlkP superfamily pyrophosphatase or phosphodiesterase
VDGLSVDGVVRARTPRLHELMRPTTFGVLREQHPQGRIAVFHDWGGFASLVGKRASDVMQHEPGAPRTVGAAIEYWKRNRPALLFIHLDNVDHAGHQVGWPDPAYYQAVACRLRGGGL